MTRSKWQSVAFVFLLSFFGGVFVFLAYAMEGESHDAYLHLMQVKRLTDPAFSYVEFVGIRPRALIAVLWGMDGIWQTVFGFSPSLTAQHGLLAFLSILFLWAWTALLSRVWGRGVALVGVLLFSLNATFLFNAVKIMSDLLAGLFLALLLLQMLRLSEKQKPSIADGALFGFLSAMMAMSKHQFFLVPFGVVAVYWLMNRWHKRQASYAWLGSGAFSFIVVVDLVSRFSGDLRLGLGHQLFFIYKAMTQSVGGTQYSTESWTLYSRDFWAANGWALIVFFGLCLVSWGVRNRKDLTRFLKPLSYKYEVGFVSLICVSVILGIHKFQIRETRYVLPVLPFVYGFLTWCFFEMMKSHSRRLQGVALATFSVALFHPAALAWGVLWELPRAYPIEHARDRRHRVFAYMAEPMENGTRCEEFVGCAIPQLEIDRVLPKFSYWYDMHVTATQCPVELKTHKELRNYLFPEVGSKRCYILPGKPGHIEVQKPLGIRITERERIELENQYGEALVCEFANVKDRHHCFLSRSFIPA